MTAEEILAHVRSRLGDAVLAEHAQCGDATVVVARERIPEVMRALRDDPELPFNVLVDLTAVDYLGEEPRFELVYHLASLDAKPPAGEFARIRARLRVKARVPEEPCEAPTVTGIWRAANWMEREVWDMYGIRFVGHPDLRRILLYEEFEGHPLRKDYPKERRQPLVGRAN